MNYLITGFPGMGKSSIAKELKRRGHTAYDPQAMHAYMHVESRANGKHLTAPEEVPRGWYDKVGAFNWNTVKIENLLKSTNDVFICSMAHNQSSFYDKFEYIFVLTLDDTELMARLNNRWGKTIGKAPSELADILAKHRGFEQSLLNRGAIKINVAHTLSEIVDQILHYINKSKK